MFRKRGVRDNKQIPRTIPLYWAVTDPLLYNLSRKAGVSIVWNPLWWCHMASEIIDKSFFIHNSFFRLATKTKRNFCNGPLARYVILRVAHAPGMPGKFSPPPRFSDPDMHHGTCVTHVPWCMSGSLTSSFLWSRPRGKTFPAFPAHAQPAILRIWQEAHVESVSMSWRCHGYTSFS